MVTIESNLFKDADATLFIRDMLGKEVKKINLYQGQAKRLLDISDLAQGVYMYQFRSGKNVVYTGRLIKND
ncbi:MAG: T9SS type A sorting domain-containing protein [Chitinophagaceae bacterium]